MLHSLAGAERFQAALGTRPCSRSAHFMLHYRPAGELSTGGSAQIDPPVDDCVAAARVPFAWLGLIVPKRHARRAVTRNLVRRESRALCLRLDRELPQGLPAGDWVLRLRAPFDRAQFPSAASVALQALVRSELAQLLEGATPIRALRRAGRVPAREQAA